MSDRFIPLVSAGVLFGALSVIVTQRILCSQNDDSRGAAIVAHVKVDEISNGLQYPSEIKDELFSRVRTFFGDKEYANLANSFVIVVGLGGVGSHAANMLVRSGVARIRLIDFDQVSLSSLNRHAVATMEDVGLSKAEVMRNKLLKVVPWCIIEAETEMFKKDSAARLLQGNPCIVLDCIDDVSTKAELIAHCMQNDIKVLTSMGAGGKADPTRLRISALADCINDPLASKIKWKLKKHDVDPEKVMSIFSVEKPMCDLLPLEEEQKNNPQVRSSSDIRSPANSFFTMYIISLVLSSTPPTI
jgi:tRNA threonylcarbamoyladenosine dehydratase